MSGRVAVVGDVFLDVVSELDDAGDDIHLTADTDEVGLSRPIDVEVGGAGVQFALAARDVGFPDVTLVGKVGGDSMALSGLDHGAERVGARLAESGIRPLWAVDPAARTGNAIILFHHSTRRFMISDPGANATFSERDITGQMRQAVASAGLLHVSGYALLGAERRAATLRLMSIAKAHGAVVAVDVVPHKIYQQMAPDEVLASLRDADWFIAETGTADGLLGPVDVDGPARDVTMALLPAATRRFPSVALFVDTGHAVVAHRGRIVERHFDSPPAAAAAAAAGSRGQSARVQAELLWGFLGGKD